jgi:hypothetical protein
MYVELPAPDCDRKHEFNINHYSILGPTMWIALFQRTGFEVEKFETIEFDLTVGQTPEGEPVKAKERFYCAIVRKTRPLDLK